MKGFMTAITGPILLIENHQRHRIKASLTLIFQEKQETAKA
jgi:hypothetical protein